MAPFMEKGREDFRKQSIEEFNLQNIKFEISKRHLYGLSRKQNESCVLGSKHNYDLDILIKLDKSKMVFETVNG